MLVLGIPGSLRAGSHNRRLLAAAANGLPAGHRLEILDLRAVPPYDADTEDPPPAAVRELRAAIAAADAVLIATPEYNSSIPGVLKNALDWASRPFPDNALRGKPVAVIGASTGIFGAVWAQAEIRKVLAAIGADVVDEEELAVGSAEEAFTAHGQLADPDLRQALADILARLLAQASPRTTADVAVAGGAQ